MSNYELHCGDCLDVMRGMDDASIDLTVTSPPYDNLRTYNGYTFDFEGIARELYRVTKPGGVVVWVVGDATINGSETGTSFRQALYFMECGFNLHDTMIWQKISPYQHPNRYIQSIEYMFVLSVSVPTKYNLIRDRLNKWAGTQIHGTERQSNGKTKQLSHVQKSKFVKTWGARYNVWNMPNEKNNDTGHPAPMPEALAHDHIISWSNPGDVVFDPFLGSGTTGKMAMLLDRRFIGIEISQAYIDEIAEPRIADAARVARKEFKPMTGGMSLEELPLFAMS